MTANVLETAATNGDISQPQSTRARSVIHLTAPGSVGGLERVVHALAVGQRDLGYEVCVVAIVDPQSRQGAGEGERKGAGDHEFVTNLSARGVRVLQFELPARAYLRERALIADVCREIAPDVLHTHGYRPDVIDAGVARKLGIPTVTTVHGSTGGDWKNRCYERLQRRAFRRFDAVVAVSAPLAQRLSVNGVASDRLHLIPNAYHSTGVILGRSAARRALAIPDDQFVIGYVGRLSREKGADVLLAAAGKLRDLPVAVSIIGDGRERAALQQQARSLILASRVIWHGMVPDAGRLLRAFDVFVLSSRTEGTPIVLLEAMAAGVPIVATHVGGVPDVVSSKEALLVPSEDPDSLASAIRTIHADIGAARARAARATERLHREFGHIPWVRQYETVYRRVERPLECV